MDVTMIAESESYDELIDYDEEEEAAADDFAADDIEMKKGHYVGIRAAGFEELLLKPELLQSIVDAGFEHPSQVQQEAIPQAVLGGDIICQARPGMGKTAVFVLATLQQLHSPADADDNDASILVLCHMRELALQIANEYQRLSKYIPFLKITALYGGVNIKTSREILKHGRPHIIVGTPGRVLTLAKEGSLKLDNMRHIVLDECDMALQELDMRRDIQEIFDMAPCEKQVMLFSATISKSIRPVCRRLCVEPAEIYMDDEKTIALHGLQLYNATVAEEEKTTVLGHLLDALEYNQMIIFVSGAARAKELNRLLTECNFPSVCIHSGMRQDKRIYKFNNFKSCRARILVTTDLFGRGIDIDRVNVVINYDFPDDSDQFLYKVGRAGRFGTNGMAISFVSSQPDQEVLEQVQKRFEENVQDLPDEIDVSPYMCTN